MILSSWLLVSLIPCAQAVEKKVGYQDWKTTEHGVKNDIRFQANGSYFWRRHHETTRYSRRMANAMTAHSYRGDLAAVLIEWVNGGGAANGNLRMADPWGMDYLTAGSGTCMVGPDEFYGSSGCSNGFTLWSDDYVPISGMCPETVPIAVYSMKKVMSSSLIRWTGSMDRDTSSAASWAVRLLHYVSGGYANKIDLWNITFVRERVREVLEPFLYQYFSNDGHHFSNKEIVPPFVQNLVVDNIMTRIDGGAPGIGGQWLPPLKKNLKNISGI